jgi:putative ABC transport system permease protein
MRFVEILRVALGAIRATSLRSFLTTLGIVIGVAAVITMVALGTGARAAVEAELNALGSDLLTVSPRQWRWRGVAAEGGAPLTSDDALALMRDAPGLKAVVPSLSSRQQVQLDAANARVDVMATTPEFATVSRLTVAAGRFFSHAEDYARRRVAVLGAIVHSDELDMDLDDATVLLGSEITIRGIRFEIIGILERKGEQPGPDPDETIYIPFRTGEYRIFGSDRLDDITLQLHHVDSMDAAMLEIESVLRREHRLRPDEENDFRIRDRSQFLTVQAEASDTLSFLLAGIAAVSLIVGGIGIMNIMLVSVTERTKEIGVRKAMGATRRNVMAQFLIEAMVLCVLGGVAGIGLGMGAARALSYFQGWPTLVSPAAIVLAVSVSVAIAIFFGVWPARRAAQLDPIEALRHE